MTTHIEAVSTNGEVQLETRLRGVADGQSATFTIKKASDNSTITTVEGTVNGGVATAAWTPEIDPEGSSRGIRIYYTVASGTHTTRAPEMEVFLDWIEVTSQDEDGNPLPDVPYVLKVGRDERRGVTGSTGTFREVDVPHGDVRFEWRGPYELVSWVDEAGPTRTAKLKKLAKMAFLYPNPGNNHGLRWWMSDGTEFPLRDEFLEQVRLVNHPHTPEADETRAEHPAPPAGSRVRCRVAAHPPEAGLAGAKVYVKAEWPPAAQRSKRNDPKPELVGGATKKWAPGAGVKALELALPADGGEVSFEVELGLAGGDQVTIFVGCTTACEDAKMTFKNERKVYHQKTTRQGLPFPDLQRVCDHLAPGHVALEADGDAVEVTAGPAQDSTVAGKRGLTFVPRRWFWDANGGTEPPPPDERVMCVGFHNWKHFEEDVFTDRQHKGALCLHTLYCDHVLHGANGDGTTPFFLDFNINLDAGDSMVNASLPLPAGFLLFPRAFHDGGFPFRDVRWSTGGSGPAALRNKSGAVPDAWIDPPTEAGNGFLVAFPDDDATPAEQRVPAQALLAGHRVRLRGRALVALFGFYGWSKGKQVAIGDFQVQATANGLSTEADGVVGYMFGHELGHSMHQAAANDPSFRGARAFRCPPGMSFGDHPFGYIGHGHVGAHCSFGMSAADRRKSNYETGVPLAGRGTCLMYGQVRDPAGVVGYCEHCTKFLAGYDMRSVHLPDA